MTRRPRKVFRTLARLAEARGEGLRGAAAAQRGAATRLEARRRDLAVAPDPVASGARTSADRLASAAAEAAARREESEDVCARLREVAAAAKRLEESARETARRALTFRRFADR